MILKRTRGVQMTRLLMLVAPAVLLGGLLLVPARGSGADLRTAGTLQLNAVFEGKWHVTDCPAGTPTTTVCYAFAGEGIVPGLGHASETYTWLVSQADPTCWHSTFSPVAIAVAGKGELDASLTDANTPCDPLGGTSATIGFTFAISGGSGAYAGALGSGAMKDSFHEGGVFGQGIMVDTWTGSLTVANLEFDTTPPVISGTSSKIVHVRKGLKRVRVTYQVHAQDAVDGSVPVSCKPRSGSFFRLGRTTVTCSATDSSANTATARFTVTVERASRT